MIQVFFVTSNKLYYSKIVTFHKMTLNSLTSYTLHVINSSLTICYHEFLTLKQTPRYYCIHKHASGAIIGKTGKTKVLPRFGNYIIKTFYFEWSSLTLSFTEIELLVLPQHACNESLSYFSMSLLCHCHNCISGLCISSINKFS